ncbi:MAG: WbqC family protein [Cyclobacteriaceae bacterium]|nr:WbqC family protein [Cyclobacteriaceae bacterium]
MQPYFFPYIGYFQLAASVDRFVVYDNIQFSKRGWINRNRILVNGADEFITLPLKRDSDYLDIEKRQLADSFDIDKAKILRKIKECYRKAPYLEVAFPVIEWVFDYPSRNLFLFVFNSLKEVCRYLDIPVEFIVSSSIDVDHTLKAEKKVLGIVKAMGAETYINLPGGLNLYSREEFESCGIALKFIQPGAISYQQFDHPFVPWLSIIDLIMFNSRDRLSEIIQDYKLI